jgi:predicted RNA-binding Zn-ribbon protein involved in translation (DUF1610 family)
MAGPIRSCPSCGYSLAGLPVSQTTCPECGADVPAAAAEAARRKRDWRDLVAVSAALILLVAASSSAGYALDRRANTWTIGLLSLLAAAFGIAFFKVWLRAIGLRRGLLVGVLLGPIVAALLIVLISITTHAAR